MSSRYSQKKISPEPRAGLKNSFHGLALCSQVAEIIGGLLAGECADERLWNLQVLGVEPAPNASRLLVKVYSMAPCNLTDLIVYQNLLKSAKAFIRRRIAEEICRKKVPDLVFEVHPHSGGGL